MAPSVVEKSRITMVKKQSASGANIFLSYSARDAHLASRISEAIIKEKIGIVTLPKKNGIPDVDTNNPFAVVLSSQIPEDKRSELKLKESRAFSDIERSIIESDISLILYSEAYEAGSFTQREMHTILTNAALNKRKRVIIVALDRARRSTDLEQHELVFASEDFEGGISHLTKLLQKQAVDSKKVSTALKRDAQEVNETEELNKRIIDSLRGAFREGVLTLVAGAGISFDAKIPDWNGLLDDLLDRLIEKHKGDTSKPISSKSTDIEDLRNRSSLIIGQYLKNSLKEDFLVELRAALYKDVLESSPIIDAICEMAKPRRAGNVLDSIVTFNFDDLLEASMDRNGIPYCEIYTEGERARPNEIPIYHVHGYLPQRGDISSDMNVVFSEDAYHDQFIDPFSWSNLIQLSKYGQNTCVFVGLSLSDPNLRRLLDVSHRKETGRDNRHYTIQKRKDPTDRNTLIESLQEQDAAGLGLGILWVNDYSEIPTILKQIAA